MSSPMLLPLLFGCPSTETNPSPQRIINETDSPIKPDTDTDTDTDIDTDTDTDTDTNETGDTSTDIPCDEYVVGDENCPGRLVYADNDNDTFGDNSVFEIIEADAENPHGYVDNNLDCDDSTGLVNPYQLETCTTPYDDNCDGEINEDSAYDVTNWYLDSDGDGFGDQAQTELACSPSANHIPDHSDCDDTRADTYPGALEMCGDSTDLNCDTIIPNTDNDADGFPSCNDCNDNDSSINPDATEICDSSNTDENCDGLINDADPYVVGKAIYYTDADSDGYGSNSIAGESFCDLPAFYAEIVGDCDDSSASINPSATEICDLSDIDENCDGLINDADPAVIGKNIFYRDADDDGYGDDSIAGELFCDRPTLYAAIAGDCDDSSTSVNPSATEICDLSGIDENCDGLNNDADPAALGKTTYYSDSDGDGYGDVDAVGELFCEPSALYAESADDCDDSNALVNPDELEVCGDGLNNDCSVTVDEECLLTGFMDADIADVMFLGATNEYAGFSFAANGDMNGDGIDDPAFAAVYADPNSVGDAGTIYFRYGQSVYSSTYDLSSESDVTLDGINSDDHLGHNMAYAGDMDGNGYDELLFSTGDYKTSDSNYMMSGTGTVKDGTVYVLNGEDPTSPSYPIGSIDISTLPSILGEEESGFGTGLAGGGDADGDGLAEFVVGAPAWNNYTGRAYIIHSPISGANSIEDMVTDGDAYLYEGEQSQHEFGAAVAYVGNINSTCDNFLAIGAPKLDVVGPIINAGAVYLLNCDDQMTSTSLAAVAIKITGSMDEDRLGAAIAGAGDHNGDGVADLAIVAPGYSSNSGVYVIDGPIVTGGDVSTLADHIIESPNFSETQSAVWVDLNDDGYDDLAIGSWGKSINGLSANGYVRILYGPLTGYIEDTQIDTEPFIYGVSSSGNYGWLLGKGDVNGDGKDDLLVSARGDDANGTLSGTTYVYLGGAE